MTTQNRTIGVGIVFAVAGLLLAAVFIGSGQRVLSHSNYESSTPASGEVLAESPAQVEVIFGQELARSAGLPSLVVTNPAGDVIADEAILDENDRTRVTIELPPSLGAGRYTVIWHTLSDEDGEEAQGAFDFFVDPSATSVPTSTGEATPTPTGAIVTAQPSGNSGSDGVPVWALIGGLAVALVVGISAGVTLGSRRLA